MDRATFPSVSFEQFSSDRLNRDSERITRDWVERLSSQLGVRPNRVLPTDDLLDGVPPVLSKAAEFLVAPDEERFTSQKLVTDQMRKIASTRRRQGYDVQEIIHEFDELAQLLDGAALHWLDEFKGTPDPKAVGRVFGRLNRAPLLMGAVTVGIYREEELESRHTMARQLREFTETLMHQLKTPLGAALLLENEAITSDTEERRRFAVLIPPQPVPSANRGGRCQRAGAGPACAGEGRAPSKRRRGPSLRALRGSAGPCAWERC